MIICLLVALMAAAVTYGMSRSARIDSAPVSSFDLGRYLGTWYEIARYDNRFERGLQEVRAEYRLLAPGRIEVVNSGADASGRRFRRVVTVEDGCLRGGVGEAVAAFFNAGGYDVRVRSLGIGDEWVEHGTPAQLQALCGYDEEAVLRALLAAAGK